MKKYIFGVVFFLAVLVTPLVQAQAAGLTTVQINAIISLLQSFGADQSVINNVQASLTGSTPPSTGGGTDGAFCHNFNTNLTVGSRGADVAALVRVFWNFGWESYGDGTNQNTIFTENTAAGVVGFQAKYGIPQTGYVGSLTRAKLNSLYGCSNPGTSSTTFSASPTYGSAPLSVMFYSNVRIPGPFMMDRGAYKIVFGDGQEQILHCPPQILSAGVTSIAAPSSCRSDPISHLYSNIGTYTAQFMYQPPFVCNAPTGVACAQVMPAQQVVGTVAITVTSGTTTQSLNVISPNGGETWTKGATQVITWQDSMTNPPCLVGTTCLPRAYDIQLVPLYVPTPCDGVTIHCNGTIPASYIITTGVSGSLYSWLVGQGHIIPAYYDTNTAPDGQYTIRVCQAGTLNCDSSDSYFTITSGTISCPTYGPIYCPNGTVTGGGVDANGCYQPGTCVTLPASSSFSASPTSGTAPLSVRFTSNVSGGILNFGDGASGTMECAIGATVGAQAVCGSSHTYTAPGTYTASLQSLGSCGKVPGLSCSPETTIGKVNITVY